MSLPTHPSLPGLLLDGVEFGDADAAWPVAATRSIHSSPYLSLAIDTIVDPGGAQHERTVVKPYGAIGVVALDDQDRVLLVEQYRHAVGKRLLEIPAGTLDIPGEERQAAAARELSEEADIVASTWESLLELYATPGYSSEHWEVFLANDLSPTPHDLLTTRVAEEADMRQLWVPFDQALTAIDNGRIQDTMTVAAILAVARRRVTNQPV
ncbi:NUDIX hydrolase [soil metagenome]